MPASTPPNSGSDSPRSGAVVTTAGDRHIPSSTRADGSLRKEIKIRPGYRPPEDVEVYKNRTAEAWKTRGQGGIPGAEDLEDGEGGKSGGAASGKNARRREARRKAKAADGERIEGSSDLVNPDSRPEKTRQSLRASETQAKHQTPPTLQNPGEAEPESKPDPEAEKEKQARNLKKKLRQARDLREKKDKGENLLPEQFEKVIKINELIRQLHTLGFDSDGAKRV